MNLKSIFTALCVGLLAASLTAPTFAGQRGKGQGVGKSQKGESSYGVKQRLRDDSCETCKDSAQKDRSQRKDMQKNKARQEDRQQLRDGTGLK